MGPAARRPSRPCVCVSRCVSRVFTFVPVNIGAKDHSLRRVAALTRCCSRPGPICRRSCRLCCDGHLRASTFTVCCGALPLERNAEPFCLALDPAEGYICPPRSLVRSLFYIPAPLLDKLVGIVSQESEWRGGMGGVDTKNG